MSGKMFVSMPYFDEDPDSGTGGTGEVDVEKKTKAKSEPTSDDGKDWKQEYQNLQRAVARKDKEIGNLTKDNDEAIQELTNVKRELAQLKSQLANVSDDTEIKAKALSEALEENKTLKGKMDRQKFVAEKFEDLLAYEIQGLLPDAKDDEELEKKLTNFKNLLSKEKTGAIESALTGAGASSGNTGTNEDKTKNLTIDGARERMMQLASVNVLSSEQRVEYRQLQEFVDKNLQQ